MEWNKRIGEYFLSQQTSRTTKFFSSLKRYQDFKDFKTRILVTTNLFGRGMDIERVNIVFNYDMPEDTDTYLHRVSHTNKIFCLLINFRS